MCSATFERNFLNARTNKLAKKPNGISSFHQIKCQENIKQIFQHNKKNVCLII